MSESTNRTETQHVRSLSKTDEKLPPESHMIEETLPLPNPASHNYLTVEVKKNPAEMFNMAKRETRNITISGMTLNWDKNDKELMSYNGNYDIKNLTIHADVLNIGAALSFASTNIVIFARKIVFVGKEAGIDTTPFFKAEIGVDGLKAGDLTFKIGSFTTDPGNPAPIKATGTAGEAGNKPSIVNKHVDMDGTPMSRHHSFPKCTLFKEMGGYNVVYYYNYFYDPAVPVQFRSETAGKKAWPKDGADAKAGTEPGSGGGGGNVWCTLENADAASTRTGGKSGPTTPGLAGQRGGTPNPAYQQTYKYDTKLYPSCDPYTYTFTMPKHESQAGKSAAAIKPKIPKGADGTFNLIKEGPKYVWISPYNLETAVKYAKDAYLNNHEDEAFKVLYPYDKGLAAYETPPAEYKKKFHQLGSEINSILNNYYNNHDFFGNPSGWVPMLSFESNLVIYKQEIEAGIRTLYLSYRIDKEAGKQEKAADMLNNSILRLQGEINNALKVLDDMVTEIPILQQHLNNLINSVNAYMEELKQIEAELLKKAEGKIELQHAIKFAMRVCAGVCQMVPVGQPAVGAVGKGFDIIADIDIDKPLDSFGQLTTLIGKTSKTYLDDAKKTADKTKKTDTKDPSKSGDSASQIISWISSIEPGLKDITKGINELKVSDDEIQAELDKLEAQSADYQEAVGKLKSLNTEKESVIEKLAADVQAYNDAFNTICHNLLAVDSLHSQLSKTFALLDREAIQYAKQMGKSAKDALVKYQYYLIKSFQYRMLKPSDAADYQLSYILDAFAALEDPSEDGSLSEKQYLGLKTIYQQPIQKMAKTVIHDYNHSGPQYKTKYTVPLTDDQIAELNENGRVVINFMKMGYWDFSQEGLRITNFGTQSIALKGDAKQMAQNAIDSDEAPANINLMFIHDGRSLLRGSGKIYGFAPKKDNSKMRWGSTYDIITGEITPIVPDPVGDTMLKELIDVTAKDSAVMTQYRPSAASDILITKKVLPYGSKADIETLNLSFDFVFFPASVTESTLYVRSVTSCSPPITLDNTDLNGCKDGRGCFLRIFVKGTTVTLTAPKTYGAYTFSKWQDPSEKTLCTDPTLKITLDDCKVVDVLYEPTKRKPRGRAGVTN